MIKWSIIGLVLVVFASLTAAISTDIPFLETGLNKVDQLLDDMSDEQLGVYLDGLRLKLITDIYKDYEDLLKTHERTIDGLQTYKKTGRQRRDDHDDIPIVPDRDIPVLDKDGLWHSYTYGTGIMNRRVIEVDNFKVESISGNQNISATYALPLEDLPAIVRDGTTNYGYSVGSDGLQPVYALNEYTKSRTGCRCFDGRKNECACCYDGSVLCEAKSDVCSPIMDASLCPRGHENVRLHAAVAFKYHLSRSEILEQHESSSQNLVITAYGNNLNFYSLVHGEMRRKVINIGISYQTLIQSVTHLGYGETLVDSYFTTRKKRFLFTYTAGQNKQEIYEIRVNNKINEVGLWYFGSWESDVGEEMRVLCDGARILIFLKFTDKIRVYEYKMDQFQYGFRMHLFTEIKFLEGDSFVSWHLYKNELNAHIVIHYTTKCISYHLRGNKFQIDSIIHPEGNLTQFDACFPLKISQCGSQYVLLCVQGLYGRVYVWDGSIGVYKIASDVHIGVAGINWSAAVSWSLSSETQVIVPTPTGMTKMYLLGHLVDIPNPIFAQNEKLVVDMKIIEAEFIRQKFIHEQTLVAIENAYDAVTNPVIQGNITIIEKVTIYNRLVTHTLLNTTVVVMNQAMYEEMEDTLSIHINPMIEEINDTLIIISYILDDSVSIAGSDIKIMGTKHYDSSAVITKEDTHRINADKCVCNSEACKGGEIEIHIENLVNKAYTGVVSGKKVFSGGITISTLHCNSLDDIDISDIVTTSTNQIITGATFNTNIKIEGELTFGTGFTLAGFDLSQVSTLTGTHHLGMVRSVSFATVGYFYADIIDGIEMNILLYNTLTTVGPVTLQGSLEINAHFLVTNNTAAATVMNINFNQYLLDCVYLNNPGVVTGTLTFLSLVTIQQSMTVIQYINGKVFPGNYPLQGPVCTFGDATFTDTTFKEIHVLGYVDTIKTSELVTITTDQVIYDLKSFKFGLHIKNDLHILTGMIDQYNLTAYTPHLQVISYNTFTFLKHVTVDILAYTSLFNRINLKVEADDIVYMDEAVVYIDSVKHFSKGLVVVNVNLQSTLNGLGLYTFVNTFTRQSIYGTKILNRITKFKNLTVEGTVDGVNILQLLSNCVYLNKRNQIITGIKSITRNIITTTNVKSLRVNSTINNIAWKRFVTLTGSYVFNSHQIFNSVQVTTNMNIDHIVCNDEIRINEIDISEYVRLRILLEGSNQDIGTIIVSNHVSASLVTATTVNHVNMDFLLSNLCYKHEDIVISSSTDIHFDYLNIQGIITTFQSNGANGISLSLLASTAIYLYMDNTFLVDSYWVKILADDMQVFGKIDGIVTSFLIMDAVYLNDGFSPCIDEGCNKITGKKKFRGRFSVEGNIEADTINALDYGKVLLTRDTDQTISGYFNFTTITELHKVYLYGDFNQCLNPIIGESDHFKNVDGDFKAYVTVIFHDKIYAKVLNVLGTVNDLKIKDILSEAIRLDQKIEITDLFTFEAPCTFGVLDSTYLNSVDWNLFISDLILSNQTFIFNSNFVVDGSVIQQTCQVTDSFIWQGTIDGIMIQNLIDGAIYIDEDYTFEATWEVTSGGISVYGLLDVDLCNGIPVSQYVTTNTVQTFTSTMITFDTCTSSGYHIQVNGLINNVLLREEYQKTWFNRTYLSGKKDFTGYVIVRGDVHVAGGISEKRINLLENIIYINDSFSSQSIDGKVTFLSPLKVMAMTQVNSDVLVNNVNLVEIEENAWFRDVETTITASMTFKKKTKLKNLQTTSTKINYVDVMQIYTETNLTIAEYNTQLNIFKSNYSLYCQPSMELLSILQEAIHELDYMEQISTITFAQEQHSSYSFQVNGITFLLMTWAHRCYSTIYRWDVQSISFVEVTAFESGYAHTWESFPSSMAGKIMLVMSADKEDNLCTQQTSAVWEFDSSVDVFNSVTVSVTMVQELQSGWSLGVLNARHNPVLHIYTSTNITYHYEFSSVNNFELVNEAAERFSKYVFAFDKEGNEIGFEVQLFLRNSVVKFYYNGVFESTHFCGGMMTDAVAVAQHGFVRLILLVDENVLSLKSHTLNIKYLVAFALETRTAATMRLVGYTVVNGGDFLVAFSAGGPACKCPLITMFSTDYESATYAFQGDEFSLWTSMPLSISQNIWGLPISQSQHDMVDEKLLMYSYSKTEAIIMQIRLRGASQIDTLITCDADTSFPLLGYNT